MNQPKSPEWIVVGIDGSDAAINAAKWAVAEATSRDIPLRLIHVVRERQENEPEDDLALDMEYGETVLRAASAALHAMREPVKVETDIVHGSPESALIGESRHAAMICVGSVGIGFIARKVLGSTAAALAEEAHCPVAIIRGNRDAETTNSGTIAAVVDDSPDNDAVLEQGFREARLRELPMLALWVWRWGLGEMPYQRLEHRLSSWTSRYPDVRVYPVAARHGAAEYLTHTNETVLLAVVGSAEVGEVARIVGPAPHRLPPHSEGCSVLVVHN